MAYNMTQMRRMAEGLCPLCGGVKGEDAARVVCRSCADKQNIRQKARTESWKSEKTCSTCGDILPPDTNRRMCPKCRNNDGRRRTSKESIRDSLGLCLGCSGERTGPEKRCTDCRKNNAKRSAASVSRKKSLRICQECGSQPLPTLSEDAKTILCETCYLKRTARARTGTRSNWRLIKNKLEEQDYRCIYTGEEIVLGINDSLDHINPTSRFPELTNDINNVQWVTRQLNWIKHDLTHDEFIRLVKRINSKFFSTE